MKASTFLLIFLLGSCFSHARTLNFDEVARVRSSVEEVLSGQRDSQDLITVIRPGEVSFTAALVVLELLLPRLEAQSPGAATRHYRVIGLIRDLLPSLSPSQAEMLRQKMMPVLRKYRSRSSSSHRRVIEIYDTHDLWSRAELWYLIPKAKDYAGVHKYYDQILKIGAEVSGAELTLLRQALTQNQTTVSALMLMYQLDILPDRRLPLLLKRLVVEVLPRHGLYQTYQTPAYDVVLTRMIPILESLQFRFTYGEPLVTTAVETLFRNTTRPEEKLFYEMFINGELKDVAKNFPKLVMAEANDPLRLVERIETQRQQAEAAKPHPNLLGKQDNILSVQFGAPTCLSIF